MPPLEEGEHKFWRKVLLYDSGPFCSPANPFSEPLRQPDRSPNRANQALADEDTSLQMMRMIDEI